MVGREAVGRGVRGDVVQPERLRLVDEEPEEPVPAGQLPDLGVLGVADAVVDERAERSSGPVPITPSAA